MIKKHKYYSVSINIINGKGRLFKVKVVINNKSAFNLVHPLLVNWRKLPNEKYKEVILIQNKEGSLYKYNNSKVTYYLLLLIKIDGDK